MILLLWIIEGLKSLSSGGTPPRFLIIDDGWQSVASEQQSTMTTTIAAGTQYPSRLIDIKENHKFQKTAKAVEKQDELSMGLKHLVQDAKSKHKLKYIYVWHALTGYWGGVKPGVAGMEHYETEMAYPVISPGVLNNEPTLGSDCLTIYGLGLVNPKKIFHFYDDLHSYLAKSGIDGVKVDVQNIIETLGVGFGGRVSITRQYHQALEASVSRNFPDNGCIACMCHNTDMLYSAKQTAVVRASDDFWPRDPASHTIHIASVAYNSLFLGEFMQPDWDMFHSLHPAAEYHAAARALGGCPVYVSDKPGNHDFTLLKKLVLPDGSILRARLPGRPTLDCLFVDPARDNKSLLKIWNINNYTGVLGAFNCQGAGWCHIDKRNKILDATPMTITGSVHARDVDSLADAADGDWNGDCAMYSHRAGDLIYLPKNTALPVTLKVLEYEVFTVAPVKNLGSSIACAPLGLLDMFNAGGAIEYLEYERPQKSRDSGFFDGVIEEQTSYCPGKDRQPLAVVKMKVRGCGRFGMYSTQKPKRCSVENSSIDFSYDPMSGLVTLVLPLPQNELHQWDVKVEV